MIGQQSTRQLYESEGPKGFARKVCHLLGVTDEQGRRYRHPSGRPAWKKPRDSKGSEMAPLDPYSFSLKDLAEATLGPQHKGESLMRSPLWWQVLQHQRAAQEEHQPIMEDTGAAAVPASAFADINAFTSVVAGLLEIEVMKGWEYPDFIMDDIMPERGTRMFDGRKVIGTGEIGDQAEPRYPGNPTKRAGFSERWIIQPRTVELALACEVLQETVYLDLTGEVLERANNVGYWVHRRQEMLCIDHFLGIINNYIYNGVNYNTYINAGYFNNVIPSNPLVFWEQIQKAEVAFRDMIDPATGSRVKITPDSVYVNQELLYTMQAIVRATELEYRGPGGMTSQPTGGPPPTGGQDIRKFGNVLRNYKIYTSPLVYQRMTDPSGLNLDAAHAGARWFIWDSRTPPFHRCVNWPLRIQQAAPNQVDLIDRGIVLFVKADLRMIPMTYEPRRIIVNYLDAG
ncbi:MAG TPA: hypothetical protein VKE94_10210 [Gemmataceae bacterium]|nr:hypothetical protein [Gemmataceae bacterium]